MAEWKPYVLPMVPGVTEAGEVAGEVAGTLSDLLTVLSGLLDGLSSVVGIFGDQLGYAVRLLIQAIQGVANGLHALMETGVYFYIDKGPLFTGSTPDGLRGFRARFAASFDDLGDKHRPQFGDDAAVSALLFVAGGDDPLDVIGPLETLGKLFGIPSLLLTDEEHVLKFPKRTEEGLSTPPDWKATKLVRAVPPFAKLERVLQRAAGMLSVGESYSDMLEGLSDVIAQKAIAMAELEEEISEIVAEITAIIEAAGLYVLPLVSTTGIPGLLEQVELAGSGPPWSIDSYVACVCLLGGTADFEDVIKLLGD